jgi:folate-binding protein YgfZ
MSNEWVETLRASGITDDKSGPEYADSVGSPASDSVQLVDLSVLKVVEISGDDAAKFLQGQFCNDLSQVSSTHAQITGYCTPKGRLLALPTIVGCENGFRLLIPNDVADNFLKRLRMFIMRSDVTVTELDDWVCVGLIASEGGQLGAADKQLGALPLSPLDATITETRQVIRWHDDLSASASADASYPGRHRYISLASVNDQMTLWKNSIDADKRSYASWRLADISAGVPSVTTGVSEAFVPQMLNLQLIDALSFTKGCYPGQEIVARMQYLGKLKRHMRLFKLSFAANDHVVVPLAGDSLSTEEDAAAGVVVDATHNGANEILMLAVAKVSANTSAFFIAGEQLQPLDLPYPLPSLDDSQADVG